METTRCGNFNSIKVRLELVGVAVLLFSTIFQFHKGTIRTSSWYQLTTFMDISIP